MKTIKTHKQVETTIFNSSVRITGDSKHITLTENRSANADKRISTNTSFLDENEVKCIEAIIMKDKSVTELLREIKNKITTKFLNLTSGLKYKFTHYINSSTLLNTNNK